MDSFDLPSQDWKISSDDLGLKPATPFSVVQRILHGGRQEGVTVIDIDNGAMTISVVPTRGMNVLEAVAGELRLGWDSPVDELVHPAFINLMDSGGLGWLQGFNELVARCGFQWFGAPGVDQGSMLSLHGLASSLPATKVTLTIDEQPPYTIRLRGELREQAFKLYNFHIGTELSTQPGSLSFRLHDTLTNKGEYAKEYSVLYHNNFGPPLLEPGARCNLPVKQVSPRDQRAGEELNEWQIYKPPTPHYGETVFNVIPYADDAGNSLAVLHNAGGSAGVSLGFNLRQLPCFALWKNTDTTREGYVTGFEPCTGFPYNRSTQRTLGLVPTIGPGEERHFELDFTLLPNKDVVDRALQQVETIRGGRPEEVRSEPLA
jgi:Domain of unknown function (DUF4432)